MTRTRTRINRGTVITVPPPGDTAPDQPPLTRADFDHAIGVLQRLSSFAQVRGSNALDEYADVRRSIGRLETYRDWWAAPAPDPAASTAPIIDQIGAVAALTKIAELEAQVRKWRGYARRNEDRFKKAQRELNQTKTTRRNR